VDFWVSLAFTAFLIRLTMLDPLALPAVSGMGASRTMQPSSASTPTVGSSSQIWHTVTRLSRGSRRSNKLQSQHAQVPGRGCHGQIYPDFVIMALSFRVPGKRVTKPEELRPAIK
jgi:hypothetical protein